jgi:uncharacterized protein (DUF342 family)
MRHIGWPPITDGAEEHAVSTDAAKTAEGVQVIVANDRLKAWVVQTRAGTPGYKPPGLEELLRILESSRILITEDVQQRVATLAALAPTAEGSAEPPPEIPEKFLIAEGVAPVESRDGEFEWSADLAEADADEHEADSIDYWSRSSIKTVEAGRVVGRVLPPADGELGRDVFGSDVPPRQRNGKPVALGDGIKVNAESGEAVTEIAGQVRYVHGKLWVEDVLTIHGDIDFDTGSVDVCVDVRVCGTVKSCFSLRTTKSLQVDKAIEAAEVEVGQDILVRGGICGRECNGRIQAGGRVTARFCNESVVSAGGEFRFDKETINSNVQSADRITGESGTIIGGDTWAREGITVGALGSDAGVATAVAVGTHIDTLRRLRQIEVEAAERIKSAEGIRTKIQPLIANIKRLTAQQREMATELMSKADELEFSVDELYQERDRLLEAAPPRGQPFVLVQKLINPGVRIRIGPRETQVTRLLHGPVKIEERKLSGVTELVAVNQQTGSVTVLPSVDVDLSMPAPGPSATRGNDDGTTKP